MAGNRHTNIFNIETKSIKLQLFLFYISYLRIHRQNAKLSALTYKDNGAKNAVKQVSWKSSRRLNIY